ncbi:MAG: thiamine pyrophosphate-dependent dehydrogenase E1 component subunit alpha [Acidimicrobiales bacterium]
MSTKGAQKSSAPARARPETGIEEGKRLVLYRRMVELRTFEKRAYDLFLEGLVKGTSHLSLGQEAVAAGFGEAMDERDYTFATYRGHAHTLSRGVPMAPVMAELMGRAGGLMSGKGGSMHLTSVEHGMMGSYAIVGAHLPIALGAGFSAKYRRSGQVSVCFFGDGTTNIGAFHEALNFAVVRSLPVVFVCENNLYMEYTPISAVTAVAHPAADRAGSYGLERIIIDGNDVEVVYATALLALDQARGDGGPSLIEALTYRHGGHSRADPATYRSEDEVASWLKKDPVSSYRARLTDGGVAGSVLEEIDAGVVKAVEEATAIARASPLPERGLATANLWSDGSSQWRN